MHLVIQATYVSFTHPKWNYVSMENAGVLQCTSEQAIVDRVTLTLQY